MIDFIEKIILYLGGPYAVWYCFEYLKRVQDSSILKSAFDKTTFSEFEKYGYLVFAGSAVASFYFLPVGFFRCAIPAAGLGMTHALSTINRGRRLQAFIAYFSSIFIGFYFLKDFRG